MNISNTFYQSYFTIPWLTLVLLSRPIILPWGVLKKDDKVDYGKHDKNVETLWIKQEEMDKGDNENERQERKIKQILFIFTIFLFSFLCNTLQNCISPITVTSLKCK